MKYRALAIIAVATLPFAAVACGGEDDTNSGERPNAEAIAEGFASQMPDVPNADAILECVGEGLEASELPNGVLRSIAAGDEQTEIDADNEEKYTAIITDVTTECATEAIDDAVGELSTTTVAE